MRWLEVDLRSSPMLLWLACLLLSLASSGCGVFTRPSNNRNWSPDMAVLPYAEIHGDTVAVHNIRNNTYWDADSYVLDYYDKTYKLNELETLDYLMIPFSDLSPLAHTMLSFGFRDQEHLAVSVEVRRQQGEEFNLARSVYQPYELMYVLGDERDLVKLRTNYRRDDVYLYPIRTNPKEVQAIFVDVMKRVNKLKAKPEFYNAATNNCTTNLVKHINDVVPGRIPYGFGVMFPAYSDRMVYSLKMLDTKDSFEETRRKANVSETARRNPKADDFSEVIRK